MAISDYLQKLIELKNQLVKNLVSKGVEATQDEKLNSLVLKVLDIEQSSLEEDDYIIKLPNNALSTSSIRNNNYTLPYVTHVIIPKEATFIGSDAFSCCTRLINITIPNTVTSIKSYAFYNCSSLTEITIPNSVIEIGACAFEKCTSLKDVYFTGTQADWNSITIGTNNGYLTSATIHYNYTG